MGVQLAQLKEKIAATKEFLESSSSLSQVINSGINSLEVRKVRARESANLFEDIVQLRQSYASAQAALSEGDMDQTAYHMAKALSLAKVLGPVLTEQDKLAFEELRRQVTQKLRERMLRAVAAK